MTKEQEKFWISFGLIMSIASKTIGIIKDIERFEKMNN